MAERDNDPNVTWAADAVPRSGRFGDVYFSAEDGLAETRVVFLQGCGLPERWSGRSGFVVAELGFGTGLNIAALLDLWRRERPRGGRLHIFSVEAFPLAVEEARRALARWPELQVVADLMLERWPSPSPGFHRVDFPEFSATLDLAVMDAAEALSAWSGSADAWFLDGFAPSTNPAMWSDHILALVAARSRPGAVAATFTVAGAVRRGLQANGFTVEKRPGFGRKRERLEAGLPGEASPPNQAPKVAVVGSGIAGAALVRALGDLGASVTLIESEAPAAGASGNPAALVTPRFDAGGGAVAGFFAQAFERAVSLYEQTAADAIIARGALQLEAGPRDPRRFDSIAAQNAWPAGALPRLTASEASERLSEPTQRGGMYIRDGLVIENAALVRRWLGDVPVVRGEAASLPRAPTGWRVLDAAGDCLVEVDAVVLAAGWGLAALRPVIRMTPARGQAQYAVSDARPEAAAWGGYVIPTRSGFLFGATFDRGQTSCEIRQEDIERNLRTLAEARPDLAQEAEALVLESRARIRATTPDHLPIAGALEPGLWVLGGLGSRGFTTAPLLAEHLAAGITGAPSPLPAAFARLVEPARLLAASEATAERLD